MQRIKQFKLTGLAAAVIAAAVATAGCASSVSGSAYGRSQARTVQQVQTGTVEAVRPVIIEGTKTPVGAATGAALGGLAASNVGGGRGKAAATIGGVVLGGLAGAAAEEGVTRRQGLEITVRMDDGRMLAVTQGADQNFVYGQRVRLVTAPDGTSRVVP